MISSDWIWNGVEGLYHEGEEYIANDASWSHEYAIYHLKGRFKAGEEILKGTSILWNGYVGFLKNKGIKI